MEFSTIRKLGSSKNSFVSECELKNGDRVAIKQLDKKVVSSSLHDRVFSAAELWQSFVCPGLVSYRSILPKDNQIVMDLMDHCLATRIRENATDPKNVLIVLRGILYSLNFLHQRRFVHANLKPTNVFIDGEGRIRLSDGFLFSMESPGTLPPPTNQKYLTPEHTSDDYGQMSPQTDLYVAGFMALELLAGERFGRGFQGIGDNATDEDHAWFQWHGATLPSPDATVFQKSCPRDLAAVIAKLVCKNQEDRYQTAQEAIRDLQDIAPDHKTKAPAAPERKVAKREATANDILDRPNNGIIIVVASGSRAGEMFGTDDMEFAIGLEPDCLIRFSEDEYPTLQCRLECRRTPSQGWSISRVRGSKVFVNQRLLDERMSLRSGDIIRLSPRGPDIQFNLQSSGFSTKKLVGKYLPTIVPAKTTGSPGTFAPVPKFPEKVNSERLTSKLPSPSPPTLPAPSRPGGNTKQGDVRPASSSNPAPSRPKNPTTVPKGPSKEKKVKQQTMKSEPQNQAGWNKSQKNWAILAIGGLVIAAVVFLLPTSESQPTKVKSKTGESKKLESGTATTETGEKAEKSLESNSEAEKQP